MSNNNLVKNGTLSYYSRGFFSNKWKEGIFELYDNGVMKCYNLEKSLICAVPLNTVSSFICVGKYTKQVPLRPSNSVENLLMCFPRNYKRKASDIMWIQFKNINELNDWVKLIFKLLPPKPLKPVGTNQTAQASRATYTKNTSSTSSKYHSNSNHLYPVLYSGTVITDHGCNLPHHPHDHNCHGTDHHHNHCDDHHDNHEHHHHHHNHDHENCHESGHNDNNHHDHHFHHDHDSHNDSSNGGAITTDYGDGGGWSNTDHGAFESSSTDYGIGDGWSSTNHSDGGWSSSLFSSSDTGGFSSSDTGGFSSSDSGGFSSSDSGGFSSSDCGGFSSSDSGGFSSSDCGGFSSSD